MLTRLRTALRRLFPRSGPARHPTMFREALAVDLATELRAAEAELARILREGGDGSAAAARVERLHAAQAQERALP